jgi:polyphosphate kinase 2 (PPK2 family)
MGRWRSGADPPTRHDRGALAVASLSDADLSLKLGARDSQRLLGEQQKRLLALRLQLAGLIGDGAIGPALCVLFEGWDAAGKGGAIRRLVSPLDPRHVTVTQTGPATEDERRHHFLHRFAPALPGRGEMAILDRSWYGRVLVERVEGLATREQWERAYPQIVTWEAALATEGMIVVKFWLHISEDEQLRRFRARERDPLKRWKLTGEDWRNLSRRAAYEQAIEQMLAETDHARGRWHVVPSESKPHARVEILRIVIAAIEEGLRADGREPVDVEAGL